MATAVSFEHVSYDYKNGANVSRGVQDLTFQIEEGSFVAILGRNGSGKSTLAKLMNAFLQPDGGSVQVLGIDTREEERLFDVRAGVGMVFQNPDNQMVASVIEDDLAFGPENLGVEREEITRRIDWALQAVGMQGYGGKTPGKLSGGQKQRVSIAAVLAMRPKILVLDESTAMLDPKGRKEVLQTVRKLNREEGMTVVLITHYMDEAVQCDLCGVMAEGRLVAWGTPQEVFANARALEQGGLQLPVAGRVYRLLGLPGPVPLTDEALEDALCPLS